MGWIRRHPFLCLAGITLLLLALMSVSGLQYDDSGAGTALFLLGYVLGQPFLLGARWVSTLIGPSVPAGILGWSLGLVPYVLADAVLNRWRRSAAQ